MKLKIFGGFCFVLQQTLDRWVSKIRSPYERVFSKDNKRVRYVGIAKNQFAEFMKAICFNLRRVTVIKAHSFA